MTGKQQMDAATALRVICAEAAQAYYYSEVKAGVREPLHANGFSNSKRQRVLAASGYRCESCGSEGYIEVDHIWPLCKGGQHWMINLQALCKPCHARKGTKLVLRSPEALAVLVGSLGPLGSRLARWALLVVAWIIRVIAAHPYATAAVVGGVAVVGGAYFATRWLREREEEGGEMRYQRIGRSVKDVARTRAGHATGAARTIGARTGELARSVADDAQDVGSTVSERVADVRDGAGDMARSLADRVGSVRVPVPARFAGARAG